MKKLIMLSLFTYALSFTNIAAQGTWISRDTLPYDSNAMVQGITGFSIGNYGYAGLGENSVGMNLTDLWQFDPSTNSWTKKAPFPGSARVAPASFVIGNNAYLVTGSIHNGGACVTECWQYNATTNTWTQKANFPGTARTYAVGFAIGGKGYVGTGAAELSDFRKDFYAYDTATNTWSRIADFGGIARDGSSGFAMNGNGYIGFGQDSTFKVYNDLWEYDTGTNSWTQKANHPSPMFLDNGFVICNNFYVGIGDTSDGIDGYREFWKYNTISDSWIQEANIPGVKRIQGAAFSIGDTGYSGFGDDSLEIPQNTFYKFYAGDSCNIITGFDNTPDITGMRIFPNPTKQVLNLNFNGLTSGPAILIIMDITGREILYCDTNIYNDVAQVDVSFLAPAMYFISIKNKDILITQKFIKY